MNYFRTAMLLAGLTALFMGLGYMIGGSSGMVFAFLFALGMNAFTYWNSDKMVLRMYGAQEVDARTAPELHEIVSRLAQNANLPMPRVYLIQNDQPNAFATGRNPEHAAVAATTGLVQRLSGEEIAGVMAHELAHIKHHDTLIMTITATIAGAISMLANFAFFFGGNRDNPLGFVGVILMAVLGPIAALLVQMAISRTREYAADRRGAQISGHPLWLASALQKIAVAAHHIPNQAAERHPATAPLFIINPLSGAGLDKLFSTHPNTENRIARLRELAGEMGITGDTGSFTSSHSSGPWSQAQRRNAGPWGS